MGKHKQISCKICFETMRSNNVKGHMKVHEKYIAKIELQTNEEMCRELVMDLVFKAVGKVDKPSTPRNDCDGVEKAGIKRKYNEDTSIIDIEALREAACKKTQEYREKIKLGEKLFKILEEEFTSEWKAALDTYTKQRPHINNENNIVLKPWQQELLKHISNPSDRKVI
jgi:hypothetical protein